MKQLLKRTGLLVDTNKQLVVILIVLLLAVLSGGAPEIGNGFGGG